MCTSKSSIVFRYYWRNLTTEKLQTAGAVPDELLDGRALPGDEPAVPGVLLRPPHLILVLHAVSSHGHPARGKEPSLAVGTRNRSSNIRASLQKQCRPF